LVVVKVSEGKQSNINKKVHKKDNEENCTEE
jgi:hypothetical protein